jgi:PD-(D/E)XK nuclease superfamily
MGAVDRSLYSHLFSYVPTKSRSPLEDFLTEAIADLLNRLLDAKGRARQGVTRFIADTLLNGAGGRAIRLSLELAERLTLSTQQPIIVDGRARRLDLCLYADNKLVLVIENKVAQTRNRRVDLAADSATESSRVERQLTSYARWLRKNHPKAGLVLLGIDNGPASFSSDSRLYPARFRSVCRWTQVWRWIKRFPTENVQQRELLVLAGEFIRFMEEIGVNGIDNQEFELLGDSLPAVHRYL